MKIMESFLVFFYILDQCYDQCKEEYSRCEEDDLGGFLGLISPTLLKDGRPFDKAIFDDWQKISDPKTVNVNNIMERGYNFLEYNEQKFGYNFSKTKQWILTTANDTVIVKAYDKARLMYQKYQYTN